MKGTVGRNCLFGCHAQIVYYSQASFKSSRGTVSDTILAELEAKKEDKIEHEEWIKQKKEELKGIEGPAWLGRECPFPTNPSYLPQKQWSDSLKLQLYKLHKSDPANWTPRNLSMKSKISIERIKAIIAMKQLEESMVVRHGYKVNKDHVKFMEKILDVQDTGNLDDLNKPKNMKINRKPTFVAVPEGTNLTAAEAAKILKLPQIKNEEANTLPKESAKNLKEPEDASKDLKEARIIRKDVFEAGARFNWIFSDVSQNVRPEKRQILVRDRNGVLRHASQLERRFEARKIWGSRAEIKVK